MKKPQVRIRKFSNDNTPYRRADADLLHDAPSVINRRSTQCGRLRRPFPRQPKPCRQTIQGDCEEQHIAEAKQRRERFAKPAHDGAGDVRAERDIRIGGFTGGPGEDHPGKKHRSKREHARNDVAQQDAAAEKYIERYEDAGAKGLNKPYNATRAAPTVPSEQTGSPVGLK